MPRNPRATGNWVIVNDADQFYNPRNGQFENIFYPSKHLFHEWHKVCSKMLFGFHVPAHVEKVELNPTFSPDTEPWENVKIKGINA